MLLSLNFDTFVEDIMTEYAAYIGIDWADHKHDICVVDADICKQESCILNHTPEAIAEWATALRTRY